MRRWYDFSSKTIDWPTMLDLLRDMVDHQWPVVVTVGSESATNFETEGCLIAHHHADPFESYPEREGFGLSSNGTAVGGFYLAPSEFREATFSSADGLDYFDLTARFGDVVIQVRDQSTHGSQSGRDMTP
jgi:hypothetical protein